MTFEYFFYFGVFFFGCAIFPYVCYLIGIKYGKKFEKTPLLEVYPPISLVISAYNEEKNVKNRLANIAVCQYPEMEMIFVNDCSTDNTEEIARKYLDKYGFKYKLIKNSTQLGTNRSYNKGILATTNEIVVTTDADVFFGTHSLRKLISRLLSDDNIGAVTGDLRPDVNNYETTILEGKYRSFYGKMGSWESASDSTFNFNGALIAFRKKAVAQINDKSGADDANMAFAAIRNGYRAVYETEAFVYENIPSTFKIQYRQKMRRATGLIEATLANTDLLKIKRPFSRVFYPLRIWMLVFSPILFFIGTGLLTIWAISYGVSGVFFLIIAGIAISQTPFALTFLLNQVYLLSGLVNLGKDVRAWESTSSLER